MLQTPLSHNRDSVSIAPHSSEHDADAHSVAQYSRQDSKTSREGSAHGHRPEKRSREQIIQEEIARITKEYDDVNGE